MNPLFVSHKGKIFSAEQPCFTIESALQFGLGVFTTVRVSNGRPENLMAHRMRLQANCIALKIPLPVIQMADIDQVIDANQARTEMWRLKILVTKESSASHVTLILNPYFPSKISHYSLTIYPYSVVTPTAKIKTLAYRHRFMIKEYADQLGHAEALTLDCKGNILESAFSNFFWVFEDCLYVPALHLPFLQGTFLTALLAWAKKTNYPVREVELGPKEIPDGSFLFVCNALTHLQAVDSIEKRPFLRNPKLEARLLQGAFEMFQDLF